MKDAHETNLPIEETGKLEETKTPEIIPENAAEGKTPADENIVEKEATEELVTEKPVTNDNPEESLAVNNTKQTKEEMLSKLTELVNASVETVRNEVEAIKQAFYKIHRQEVDELKKAFLEAGGDEKNFIPPDDETEIKIKKLLNTYKAKKASTHVEDEQRKAANYALKLQLISRMKELTESQDDFNKLYNEFKEIQQRWKEAKPVPQKHANELWKNYQIYSERFYDLIKINNQLRDYDFRKNLEAKTTLCETVEKLEHEPDIVSAFHQLQKLHQQWRETGPVARELREEVWTRFKTVSAAINKRYQEHFETMKTKEQESLAIKTALCKQIETIDFSLLNTFKKWEEKNKEVIACQEKWKHTGFAPRKYNVKLFERFRAACDAYFTRKVEFYKSVKEELDENLGKKRVLCEKAEALKNSTDWKDTTDKLIALQKEWRSIGAVPRKHSDALWKRFVTACDCFFEQKNKNVPSQKNIEQSNLAGKKELIKKIKALNEVDEQDKAQNMIKNYMNEWNAIGFVPFKEKDKINKEYQEAIEKQFDRLKINRNDYKIQTFRSTQNDMTSGDGRGRGKLYGERDKLMRTYERMKNELQTYENNIGFLSSSSKGGSGLIKEMERKIEKLKEEMEIIIRKIDTIDENLE
ncbi:MAG: DUF349 domain-containing protein [Tannerellaceae bacterium]|nr:DUF349 domain-containing protein [Tannerellaceae bacterium]